VGVVDDNATNRRILDVQLQGWGVRPQLFESGDAVAHAWLANPDKIAFDVLVLDVQMPGMDGYELAELVASGDRDGRTRFIFLTSSVDASKVSEDVRIRTVAMLTKPVRQGQLYRALALAAGHAVVELPDVVDVSEERTMQQQPRVLLAEDNQTNQKVATLMLTKAGYRVDVASNGAEAVRLALHVGYDVILMDCQMPEMDGYEAARRIRERESGSHTPILALTASVMAEDQRECLAAGMDDLVPKPFTQQILLDALAKYVDDSPNETPGG
jgi:CheY-like chemotaxis protein